MKILPNQIPAFRYPAEAWQAGLNLINTFGDKVITEDRKLTKEICNLHLTILEPLAGWPIAGSGWDLAGLDRYAEQLMDPAEKGFDYDYGNRLREYPQYKNQDECDNCGGNGVAWTCDQIAGIIDVLKRSPSSRRAIAIAWIPYTDLDAWCHVPCLQLLDFLIRGGKLQCTAVFRSQDFERAWPCNVYGIGRLMQHIGDAVGVPVGSLTIVAASAHVYED